MKEKDLKQINRVNYDVAVIGGGHAGVEAALAAARLGKKTIVFAINLDSIAMMPCNPNIGGTSKGHLVREIDALGGEMGKNTDKTFIQSKMLNETKGPAVHSLRAQVDKKRYQEEMKKTLEKEENISLYQAEVTHILIEDKKVVGVEIDTKEKIYAKAVIIATGTYLNARCLYGEVIIESGPDGFRQSKALTDSLRSAHFPMFRFKTGTPARVSKKSLDFSKMKIQLGDEKIVPFSFENEGVNLSKEQIPCYLTFTNEKTHEILEKNIHRSPMYSGTIEGTGTRYCPSIEDKIVRFPDKERHQVFIEPEGAYTDEMYVAGLSSSLPAEIVKEVYQTVSGMEDVSIMRNAYAIEYDCIDATSLTLSLESKEIGGLFSAGQVNGSSGYEEAAAQGLMAGINAARKIDGLSPIILKRSDAYIGVLIDDLVTKGTNEPYRMMTSRAEHRLLLRQDNADLRLTDIGYEIGLISEIRYEKFLKKRQAIEDELERVKQVNISPSKKVTDLLSLHGTTDIPHGAKLVDLLKRPELSYEILEPLDIKRPKLSEAVKNQVNISIKYEGYIKRQFEQVAQQEKMETQRIPKDIEYKKVSSLRNEAVYKLEKIRPENIGQASRILGVSPADIHMLLVYLAAYHKSGEDK